MRNVKIFLIVVLALTFKFSSAQTAADFNGSGQFARTKIPLTASAMTLEFDIYPRGNSTLGRIFSTSNTNLFELAVDGLGTIRLLSSPLGISWQPILTVPMNTFSHVAVSYQPGQIRVFLNGTQVAGISCPGVSMNFSAFQLGSRFGSAADPANITLDNFRLWSDPRTPP